MSTLSAALQASQTIPGRNELLGLPTELRFEIFSYCSRKALTALRECCTQLHSETEIELKSNKRLFCINSASLDSYLFRHEEYRTYWRDEFLAGHVPFPVYAPYHDIPPLLKNYGTVDLDAGRKMKHLLYVAQYTIRYL
ncbi:hypothetical protein BT63DRAFT_160904 [Microthyrium microscopicum]|uniref:F-box domain-containing protein n=1 Tax=Microthyrium microscopicum TaxID=703497 RepID=A0A6A6UMU7_9PEZI|nr:hypothetical protein BT63DRAFT_160904 [Microthyrium microscopicum]